MMTRYVPSYLGIRHLISTRREAIWYIAPPVIAGTLARPVRTSRPWIPRLYSRLPRPQKGGPSCPSIRPSNCHLSIAVSNSFDRSNGSARSLITYTHSRLGQEYRAPRLTRHPCFFDLSLALCRLPPSLRAYFPATPDGGQLISRVYRRTAVW